MAAYTLKSDKMFLRCFDMEGIEVYELDSPYIYPVKGKHWSHIGISIAPGKKYEALKIGDKEIKSVDLQTLIKDLFNSRLIVNREGLCFLATTGVTSVVLEVEYYRQFDVFNWSRYQAKTSVNTKWSRKDIVDGRPLEIIVPVGSNSGDVNDQKVKELEEEKKKELEEQKNKHKAEIEEVERKKEAALKEKQAEIGKLKEELVEERRKKQEEEKKKEGEIEVEHKNEAALKEKQAEIDKLKKELAEERRKKQEDEKKKDGEIAELKRKHKEELVRLEQRKQQELKWKQDELERKQKQNEDLEKELKIHSFQKSTLSPTDYFKGLVQLFEVSVPSSAFIFQQNVGFPRFEWPPSGVPETVTPLGPSKSILGKPIPTELYDISYAFDSYNWRSLRVGLSGWFKSVGPNFCTGQYDLIYYEGNKYEEEVFDKKEKVFIPCHPIYLVGIGRLKVRHISGIGLRMTI
ncbi:hypothetical protein BVRB_6g156230 [Beta vulgaris subsp. vulgaris]|uniref:Uncharacterized protein n=1 Tax=Beta vulgaris subsp. vulgaris TaxID=3555 RepID=A0A0J8B8M0_BETVV|nr:hypothetical protein BVRB_6g156230 [Beta vulgaris subsp. vulgaris]